jgi:hypothetical protein
VRCTEVRSRAGASAARVVIAGLVLGLSACGSAPPGRTAEPSIANPVTSAPGRSAQGSATPSTPVAAARTDSAGRLPAPGPVRNWDDVRVQAAKRLVAAHPNGTYLSKPPDVLLAIPVIETELNADGSIKRIQVLRHPGQAKDTTQIAIDAIKRAAPYGDISRLPKPWKFVEVFLFNDDRKFKPRTLDN